MWCSDTVSNAFKEALEGEWGRFLQMKTDKIFLCSLSLSLSICGPKQWPRWPYLLSAPWPLCVRLRPSFSWESCLLSKPSSVFQPLQQIQMKGALSGRPITPSPPPWTDQDRGMKAPLAECKSNQTLLLDLFIKRSTKRTVYVTPVSNRTRSPSQSRPRFPLWGVGLSHVDPYPKVVTSWLSISTLCIQRCSCFWGRTDGKVEMGGGRHFATQCFKQQPMRLSWAVL